MGCPTASSVPAAKALLEEQLLEGQRRWLQGQRLAFADELGEMRFDSEALADEIGLTVNLTRFEPRESRQAFAHRASCLPGQAFEVETDHFNG